MDGDRMSAGKSKTVAILLAAGESRRMGQLKAMLPWRGLTLLEHQVSALGDGGADEIIVVLGHRSGELRSLVEGRPGVTCVLNPDYLQGKTTSIKAGLRAVDPETTGALLFLNVDQPRDADTILRVVQAHLAGEARFTIPCCRGKGGHPTLADASLLGELLEITEDTQGMRAVVQRHGDRTRRLELDAPEVLWDLNTPEQYEAALRQ